MLSDQEPGLTRERWKWVPGQEHLYQVSDCGRVRSFRVCGRGARRSRTTPRLISLQRTRKGYLKAPLSIGGAKRQMFVHRLVLLAFVGKPADGEECAHLDGDAGNNQLANLRWVSKSSNNLMKAEHGTVLRGERNLASKLSSSDVRCILGLLEECEWSLAGIARAFDVSPRAIAKIRDGETWNEVAAKCRGGA